MRMKEMINKIFRSIFQQQNPTPNEYSNVKAEPVSKPISLAEFYGDRVPWELPV